MNNFDTFLPSGAVEQRRSHMFAMSPPGTQIPRSVPPTHFPNFPSRRDYSSSPHRTLPSPPKTRSTSTDEDSAALIEDWRTFTRKIREQAQGERAHLLADRARADEVMEEERQLWEQERNILKARIEHLETELASKNGSATSAAKSKSALKLESVSASGSGSVDMSPASSIPQESGRNPDGSPFYAPAPTNPSRSFDPENQELRIDSITEPREGPIRVTSKSLRPVDFGIQSPERQAVQEHSSTTVGESIDISFIQPTLEGVPIKTSAVDPIFAATVLSPQSSTSPAKRSPNNQSPEDENDSSPPGTVRRNYKKRAALEVHAAPEDRRLTLHAGHTPNHSISKFEMAEDSGNTTPTQAQSDSGGHIHHTSMDSQRPQFDGPSYEDDIDEDPELTGYLGFTDDATAPENDVFARELVKRLSEEALRQSMESDDQSEEDVAVEDAEGNDSVPARPDRKEYASPSSAGSDSPRDGVARSPPIDGLPKLRIKPSVNFGKPFGTL